jgi:hypothetical protein
LATLDGRFLMFAERSDGGSGRDWPKGPVPCCGVNVEEEDSESYVSGLGRNPSATGISLRLEVSDDREAIEFRCGFVLEDGRSAPEASSLWLNGAMMTAVQSLRLVVPQQSRG